MANDVLQNGRKKGEEYVTEFKKILKESVVDFYNSCNDDFVRGKVLRVVNIWNERNVYDAAFIDDLKASFKDIPPAVTSAAAASSSVVSGGNVNVGGLEGDKYTKYVKFHFIVYLMMLMVFCRQQN